MRTHRRKDPFFLAKASKVMKCTDTESEVSQVHFRGLFSLLRKYIVISSRLVILRNESLILRNEGATKINSVDIMLCFRG
jgi:hypothetical protein